MALSLLRRSILRRIKATGTLDGRLRSLATATCDYSSSNGLMNASTIPLPSNGDDDSDQVNWLASLVTKKIDDIIESGEPPFPLLFGAEVYSNHTYDEIFLGRLIGMNQVVDLVKNFPEVDKIQVFHAKIYYESMLRGDYGRRVLRELTKDEIIARVLKVTQRYPKVGDYKVTKETHFCKDLRFDKWDVIEIIQALQVEFKLDIPDDIDSCKLAIEYIYDHRVEILSLEEFQKRFLFTGEFGESKSEVRRMYLRAEEMGAKHTMSNSERDKQLREVIWNGIKLSQLFINMQYNWFPEDIESSE